MVSIGSLFKYLKYGVFCIIFVLYEILCGYKSLGWDRSIGGDISMGDTGAWVGGMRVLGH